jgi:Mn2+/Fe2+ NRAMP family transporter
MADKPKTRSLTSVIFGAAFLMATSAVGPGFLTQTTVFTKQLLASFGFVILLSIILDIFAQLNIWRVLAVTGKRGQELANDTIAGTGYLLSALVAFGGLAFNIGNIAGAGLGMNAALDVPVEIGAAVSALLAIALFLFKEAGRAMDMFVKVLGVLMIVLIGYVVYSSSPPIADAAYRTVWPEQIDARAVVTLVGGTVGGYITFAGAHRLIDAGVTGPDNLPEVTRGAYSGILFTAIIRFCLFLAALGVITMGLAIDDANPPASVFQNAAGTVGLRIFGVVMWAAAITSVVGAAFTSVSFIKTLHSSLNKKNNYLVIAFIVFSTLIFLAVGRPVSLLIWAGTINGFILPLGLSLVLIAVRKMAGVGSYKHPLWLEIGGWGVVAVMLGFMLTTLIGSF